MKKNIKKKKNMKRRKKHPFLRILLLILIIIAIYFIIGTIKRGGGLSGFLATALGQSSEEIENLEPISVLILGSSQNMTDTIMIAKYNPKTQQAYLLSIPRDTFVGAYKNTARPGDKINSIYQGKNTEKVLQAVNKLTNLNLKYYAIVDTEALRALVDAIGGVYYDVPIDMKYTDKKQNLYIDLKKGEQLLDGNKAEQLVRFRHNKNGTSYPASYGDNDMGRMKTQRNFLKAVMKQTLKPSNIFKIKEFIDISQKYVKTNLSFDLLKKYVPRAVEFNTDNLETETLPGNPEKCNGVWLFILDKAKTKKYIEELDKKLMGIEQTDEENKNEAQEKTNKTDNSKIKIEILNGSGNTANLTQITNLLKNKGFTIYKTGKTNSTTKTSIIKKSKISDDTTNSIREIVGVGTVISSNSKTSSPNVTIILGKDYK